MTNYEIISLIFAGLTNVGIVAAILQIRDTRKWNKMSMAISYLPPPNQLNELEEVLNSSFLKIIDRTGPLTERELESLLSDEQKNIRIKLKNYLNMLEGYCAAVNYQIIDSDVARAIYRYKFERHFVELKPYIDRMRGGAAASFMDEMEEVLRSWKGEKKKRRKY
jgi:hypothetical protein